MLVVLQYDGDIRNIQSVIQLSKGHTETHLIHRLVTGPLDAEVDHGVGQAAPHVELQTEVVHPLGVLLVIVLLGADPSGHQVVLDRVGEREEVVSEKVIQ